MTRSKKYLARFFIDYDGNYWFQAIDQANGKCRYYKVKKRRLHKQNYNILVRRNRVTKVTRQPLRKFTRDEFQKFMDHIMGLV